MSNFWRPVTISELAAVDVSGAEFQFALTDIEGVVSPRGQGGWPRSDKYKVHHFDLAAWRPIGSPIVRRELFLLRPIPLDDDDYFTRFPEFSILRLRVLLSTDLARAIYTSELPPAGLDEELLAIADELKLPLNITVPRFGKLSLDRRISWFCGKGIWNGIKIDVHFDTSDPQSIHDLLPTADKLWRDELNWKRNIDDYAVNELLPVKNEFWLDDGKNALSANEFKSRMTLLSVTIRKNGVFEFWYDDGDMFLGHSIQVSGSLDSGLTTAGIHG